MIIYDIEDREYEVYGIENFSFGSGNIVRVSAEGESVACYSFDCTYNDSEEIRQVLVHQMHVNENFKRRHISTAVLEQIKEVYPNAEITFQNSLNNPVEDKNEIHYSDEGLFFMEHCCVMGLVNCDEDE